MKCGLDIIPSEYARSVLKFGLMEVVYEWARGVPFRDICTLTSVQEGIIVRTITRLDETCREVRWGWGGAPAVLASHFDVAASSSP